MPSVLINNCIFTKVSNFNDVLLLSYTICLINNCIFFYFLTTDNIIVYNFNHKLWLKFNNIGFENLYGSLTKKKTLKSNRVTKTGVQKIGSWTIKIGNLL